MERHSPKPRVVPQKNFDALFQHVAPVPARDCFLMAPFSCAFPSASISAYRVTRAISLIDVAIILGASFLSP